MQESVFRININSHHTQSDRRKRGLLLFKTDVLNSTRSLFEETRICQYVHVKKAEISLFM